MTLLEFIFSVAVVGMIVLQCAILLELRELRHTLAARDSTRRRWVREEHEVD